MLATALDYAARGWPVIQLHDVSAGQCSCLEGPACPSAGKHPLARAWQAHFLADAAAVANAWAWRPQAGVGIVTGPASGVWVFDVDPDHGGADSLAELVAAYGRLPDTHTVQTGSGGLHYYFALTGVEFDLSNRKGRLGPGLDVRGRGGFVVAPPSVSGRGAYRVLTQWVGGVAVAPGWLVEQVRPAPARERTEFQGGEVAREGHAYAATAVRAQLAVLAGAQPGGRNETAFKVACRLIELCRADWAGLDFAEIEQAFISAGAAANTDGRFMDGEVWSVWLKAQGHVKVPAVLPPAEHLGSFVGWDEVGGDAVRDFGSAGQGPAPGGGGDSYAADMMAGAAAIIASASGGAGTAAGQADPFETAVAREAWNLAVREEARRRLDASHAVAVDWAAEILDEDQMRAIPRPVPLISGWLFRDTLARIIGASGSMKSFTVVDMAVCVANGMAWHGSAVTAGPVLWVVAEGASDADLRLRAAKERYSLERHGVRVIVRPVQVGGLEWDSFVAHLAGLGEQLRPALVIFDTQARVTEGVKENDAAEMGSVVGAAEKLRAATGACVLLVHHTGLGDGERGRGSGAVYNALTTEILVARSGSNLTLTGMKQKTIATGARLMLTAVVRSVVDVGEFDIITEVGETVVLVGALDGDAAGHGVEAPTSTRDIARERALQLVEVLRREFGQGNGGSRAEIRGLFLAVEGLRELSPAGQKSAWQRAWGRLEELGRIARNPIAERFRFVEVPGADDLAANPNVLTEFGWPIAEKRTK